MSFLDLNYLRGRLEEGRVVGRSGGDVLVLYREIVSIW